MRLSPAMDMLSRPGDIDVGFVAFADDAFDNAGKRQWNIDVQRPATPSFAPSASHD